MRFAVLGLMALVWALMTYSVVPGVRSGPGVVPFYDNGVQTVGYVLAAVVVGWRALRVAEQRLLWSLVALALALRSYGFIHTFFVLERGPVYPSLADAAWIVSGLLLVVALIVPTRRLLPWASGALCLDALLGALTAAALTTTLLYGTLVRLAPDGAPTDVLAVNLAYPVLDAGLLVVVATLVAATHGRLAPPLPLLVAGSVIFASVDALFLYQVTVGTFRPGSFLAPLSLGASLVIAAAALVPDREHGVRRDLAPGLTTPVALAALCVLVLAYDAVRPVPAVAILLASSGVLVAIGRGLLTFGASRRDAEATLAEKNDELLRFRALVEASSDFIGIGTLQGEVIYVNPAGRELIGWGQEEDLGGMTIGDTLYEGDRRRAAEVERPRIMEQGFWRGESTLRHLRGGRDTPVMKNTFLVRRPGTAEPWLLSTIQRDVSDLRAVQQQLQQVADQRQVLLQHLVEAQEAERARIAADVHDDPVQAMAAVDLQLGLVERLLLTGTDPEETLALVARMRGTVSEANDRLRYLLFDLDSPAQREDVETALGEAAAYVLGDAVRWDVRCEPDLDLDETARVLVYRIAKEAMVNVRKHARASRVHIDVRRLEGGVEVTVSDDGVGLAPDEPTTRPGHRGVSDMRDRAAIAGGSVTLSNGDERGAVMRLWVPVSHHGD